MNLTLIDNTEITVHEPHFNLDDLINRFIDDVDVKNNSKNTYRRQIRPFLNWIFDKYALTDFRYMCKKDIYTYRQTLIDSEKSVSTVNGYMTVVKIFFGWLESNKIFQNITKGVKNLQTPKGFRKDCLTVEQIRQALSTFDLSSSDGLRNYSLFNLLVRTGLRTVEISRATIGDLRQKYGEAILNVQGKGRDSKDDFVLLVGEALDPLRRYLITRGQLKDNDPLFSVESNRCKGKSLSERMISFIIKETLKKININDSRLTAHSLRHTAISLSISNGATLIQAQAMARHSDPKTTMIYFHNDDRIKNGAERMVII